MVLEDARSKLTRQELLQEWPADFDKPHPATLFKWLDRAVREKLVAREGSGRKSEPFRYWLPECEAEWQKNPLYQLLEQSLKNMKTKQRFPVSALKSVRTFTPEDES